MKTKLLFTHALSPLHAGTGQGIGVIDLPIAREKATGLPFLPGSSVKGTSRDSYLTMKEKTEGGIRARELTVKYFGPDAGDANVAEYASALQFSDQKLLLLPVRSLIGTFVWVTSPYILSRFKRDANDVMPNSIALMVPTITNRQNCFVANPNDISNGKNVYLEDLDLIADDSKAEVKNWADKIAKYLFQSDTTWKDFLSRRFCIVSDDVMSFLVETATEVSARIRLEDDTKTVKDGSLWYEEALPCETVLYGMVSASKIGIPKSNNPSGIDYIQPNDAMQQVDDLIRTRKVMQFGGKGTVGRGICHLYLS